jgi:hypothetical protein
MNYMNEKYVAQKHAEDMDRAERQRLARSVPRKPNWLLAVVRRHVREENTQMPLYRKKPVVVEARQFTPASGALLAEWCGGYIHGTFGGRLLPNAITIPTLEGEMTARLGDWIVKGSHKDEYWPVREDIFAETYEPVEEG